MGQSSTGVSRRNLRELTAVEPAPPAVREAPRATVSALGWHAIAGANGLIAVIAAGAVLAAAKSIPAAAGAFALCLLIVAATTAAYRHVVAEAARLAGELEDLSSRDTLTGSLNKVAFERTFQAWVGNGMRRRVETALLLVDVDQLQKINAEHGHEAGDAALRQLSDIIKDCIRETDAFGRLEGGEFGLLFPATSGPEAMIAAERIRAIVERRSAVGGYAFTISVGVTGGHSFSDPWAAAERALDLAKAAGSNRVVLAETETQAEPELEELPFAA